MLKMSDSELQNYIDNKDTFRKEAVSAAIRELKKRNSDFEELEVSSEREVPVEISSVAVEDSSVLLYSSKFILLFGVLFSVFGGGILMAMNFVRINKKESAYKVILYSLLYAVLQVMLLEYFNITSPFVSLPLSFCGIYLLEEYIWKKEIPSNLKYEKRDVWKPIIVGMLIVLPLAIILARSGG